MVPFVTNHEGDWEGSEAIVLHIYQNPNGEGACAFTTFALQPSAMDAEVIHTPMGTPVQSAFAAAIRSAKQLGIEHVLINDPGNMFRAEDAASAA